MDGFVLAGGLSQRMGVDKGRIPFPYRHPMAIHVAKQLAQVCARVALVRRGMADGLPWIDAEGKVFEVVRDLPNQPAHPLWGLAAALDAAQTERVLIVPCDLPYVTGEVLQELVQACSSGPVIAEGSTGIHPLFGVFPKSWSSRVKQAAAEGKSARSLVEECPVHRLPECVLMNVNRWEDCGKVSPLTELVQSLDWLDAPRVHRVVLGEIARMSARGVVDPMSLMYNSSPMEEI
jgi:molybdopterin-guanine dinucleotide biosynthesis protein A